MTQCIFQLITAIICENSQSLLLVPELNQLYCIKFNRMSQSKQTFYLKYKLYIKSWTMQKANLILARFLLIIILLITVSFIVVLSSVTSTI